MPHDRQFAEIVGSHWSRGRRPYHTGGQKGDRHFPTWPGTVLPLNFQGKAPGSLILPVPHKPGPIHVASSSERAVSAGLAPRQFPPSLQASPTSPTSPSRRGDFEDRASPPVVWWPMHPPSYVCRPSLHSALAMMAESPTGRLARA